MADNTDIARTDDEINSSFDAAFENQDYAKVAHWTLPNSAPVFNVNGYMDFVHAHEAEYAGLFNRAIEELGNADKKPSV